MPGGAGLPEGPARTRAGDADRDLAVEALRRHWREGRLETEELEARVERALQARTLGQLRKLLGDLPGEASARGRGRAATKRATTNAARVRRTRRRTVAGLVSLGMIGGVVAAATDDERTDRDPFAAGGPRPSFAPPPEERITRVPAGETGRDGSFGFRLEGIRRTRRLAGRNQAEDVREARRGREFLVAEIRVVNRGERSGTPFCSRGARLITTDDVGHDFVDDLFRYAGGELVCGPGITPDEAAVARIAFEVPRGAQVRDVDVWDRSEDNDISGATRLRLAPPRG